MDQNECCSECPECAAIPSSFHISMESSVAYCADLPDIFLTDGPNGENGVLTPEQQKRFLRGEEVTFAHDTDNGPVPITVRLTPSTAL